MFKRKICILWMAVGLTSLIFTLSIIKNPSSSDAAKAPTKNADFIFSFTQEASTTSDLVLTDDESSDASFVFAHQKNSIPIIERSCALSASAVCHYGLFQIETTPIAVFYTPSLSVNGAEKLMHLVRCYLDYFPLIIIGHFDHDTTTLLQTVVGLKPVFTNDFTIFTSCLIPTDISDTAISCNVTPPAKALDLNKPMVAITYDDGPSPYTPKILDAIATNGAKATFYVLGAQVELHPETVREIFKTGCEIGNHTNLHEIFSKNSTSIILKSIEETNTKIRNIIGIGAATVRPPTGALNNRHGSLVTTGYPIILWSIDTRDFENTRNEHELIESIIHEITDGAIVLLHDIHETTANASNTLFQRIIQNGFQCVTVSELLEFKANGASADTVCKGDTDFE